ncbi:MAG: helix-turn-helix transcriptional regulator [Bacteroidales bacterium]|nr:helix-turn-helix transcriptional regulator [Bacteroidales bacterium]
MDFSDSIKQIRKATYLSQESFAKEIGVSFSTVNRWENGKTKPNYSAMKRIASFCGEHSLPISFVLFHKEQLFTHILATQRTKFQ